MRPEDKRGLIHAGTAILFGLVLIIVGAAVAPSGAIGASTSTASRGVEATTEVPPWMTRACEREDSVNCHWDGGTFKPDQGQMFVRKIPGRNLVCVMYVNHPRRDYCERYR